MGNPDRHFWPGQFDDVNLVLSTEKGAVLIPNQAVQISQKGSVVCRDRSVVGSPTRAGRKTNLLTVEKMAELAAMPRPRATWCSAEGGSSSVELRHTLEYVGAMLLFKSLELTPLPIAKRLAAVYARVLDRAVPRRRRALFAGGTDKVV